VSMPTFWTHRLFSTLVFLKGALFLWSVLVVLYASGCATQRRPRFQVADVAFARPIVPQAVPDHSAAIAPDIEIDVAILPPQLVTTRAVPAKPHIAPPPPTEPARSDKPPVPILEPELSSEELAVAQTETQRSLAVSDQTLALTQNRHLNSAQNDLVSQVRGFAQSARDATREGDWSRAKSLAKKAEVLSQELAGTL
jgi:hypothetical protein